jgi:2-dehydro-3-deoxy-D-pentonate aldolase
MTERLHGIIPAMVTPMDNSGNPDEAGIRRLTDYLIAGGVSALFPCGSTGEGPRLLDEQWAQGLSWVVSQSAGRVPILAPISDLGTERVLHRAAIATDLGVDALVSTLPFYYPTMGLEAMRFFETVADSVSLPLYIYNLPQRTQGTITLDEFLQLAAHPNIYGVKDSAVDVILHFGLIHSVREQGLDFVVLNGSEFFLGASVTMGGDGGLLGIATVAPRLCVDLYEAAARGDIPEVRRLQAQVSDVTTIFFTRPGSPLAAIKRALEMLGLCGPGVSHPFASTTPEQDDDIRAILERNALL